MAKCSSGVLLVKDNEGRTVLEVMEKNDFRLQERKIQNILDRREREALT